MATPAEPVDCSEVANPELVLDKQMRYRIRLLNVGWVIRSEINEQHLTLSIMQCFDWVHIHDSRRRDESFPG